MVKKKKELTPEAIEHKSELEIEELKKLAENIDKFDFEPEKKDSETFYKIAIKELFNNENVEQKTEWLNPLEVFEATKLQFLGDYGNIPILKDFISGLERKRISLNRKGREEIILSLQERRQEEMEVRKQQLLNMGLMGR